MIFLPIIAYGDTVLRKVWRKHQPKNILISIALIEKYVETMYNEWRGFSRSIGYPFVYLSLDTSPFADDERVNRSRNKKL